MNRLRVTVVAPWVPQLPARHAGGDRIFHHLQALARHHDVHLVAPVPWSEETPRIEGVHVHAIRYDPAHSAVQHAHQYARWLIAGVGWSPRAADEMLAKVRSGVLSEDLGATDLLEVQYTESLPVAVAAASSLCAPLVLWNHDVVSLELRRQLAHARSVRLRLEALVRLPAAGLIERRLLPRCSGAVVFNPHDSERLVRRGLRGPSKVARPLAASERPAVRVEHNHAAIFVAAFDRPTNREGLQWLLREVWPRVRAAVPDAELMLVGSGAPTTTAGGVRTIGFVADIEAEYQSARVAVAPLLSGAGLKFKVPDAFSHGLPVVATTIAAEGLSPPDNAGFAAVTDHPARFARALTSMLCEPERAAAVGAAGRAWWGAMSESWLDEDEIADWYRDLARRPEHP